MKELFPGFYPNSNDAIDLEIQGTVVAFDANVLLNLYRYPTSASEDLLNLMAGLGDKVWLPYHAALEYQRNRLAVIAEQKKRFRETRQIVEKGLASLEGDLSKLQLVKRHSTINVSQLLTDLAAAKATFFTALDEKEAGQRDVNHPDSTRERIATIFAGRIGEQPTEAWLKELEKEAQARYATKRPPGFCDLSKQGETFVHEAILYRRELGDLIVWKQLLENAKTKHAKQVIFITDDEKEDWWLTVESGGPKRIGPRPELIEEAKADAGIESFYMLTSERFTQRFATLLNIQLGAQTVAQVTDVKSTLAEVVRVNCPDCKEPASILLGAQVGSSALEFCKSCGVRYHIHRAGDGTAFTKAWGSSEKRRVFDDMPVVHRVEATCPTCQHIVPANVRDDEESTFRYCMQCSSLLQISNTGTVLNSEQSAPLRASQITGTRYLTYLTCPECPQGAAIRAIWGNGFVARTVCPSCSKLIEGDLPAD